MERPAQPLGGHLDGMSVGRKRVIPGSFLRAETGKDATELLI